MNQKKVLISVHLWMSINIYRPSTSPTILLPLLPYYAHTSANISSLSTVEHPSSDNASSKQLLQIVNTDDMVQVVSGPESPFGPPRQ